jgi:hypothetical protein
MLFWKTENINRKKQQNKKKKGKDSYLITGSYRGPFTHLTCWKPANNSFVLKGFGASGGAPSANDEQRQGRGGGHPVYGGGSWTRGGGRWSGRKRLSTNRHHQPANRRHGRQLSSK